MAVTDRIGRMLLLTRLYSRFEETEEAGMAGEAGEAGEAGRTGEAEEAGEVVGVALQAGRLDWQR